MHPATSCQHFPVQDIPTQLNKTHGAPAGSTTTARFLRAHGCDEAQGYYFSKPVPEHEFARLVLKDAGSRKLLEGSSKNT